MTAPPPSGVPESTPLDGLLDEVRELRLTLASDLSLAASAAEIGADQVTRDIVEADQRELARFVRVAELQLARVQGVGVAQPRTARWRHRVALSLPAVPLVGAMALSAAAATGALPLPNVGAQHHAAVHAASTPSTAPVDSTFQQFVTLVDGYPSATQVLAAAAVLHRQLADLIATNAQNPDRVAEIEQLLAMEQSLLQRRQPPGTPIVLAAARRLAERLVTVAKPVASASSLVPTPVTSTHRATTKTSPSPTATTSAPPSAQPAPTTAPSAAPTPTPTSSPSSNQIPNIPG